MIENRNGTLYFDGCNTLDIVETYGSPLYVFSENLILKECNSLKECFLNKYDNTRVAYAAKAFLSIAMCQLMEREGLCIDVVSGGELYTCIKAGFPSEKIEFNGNNKTPFEIEMALDYNIGRFIVDNLDDLALIESICKEKGKVAKILFRITPEVKINTHTFISTGQKDSKFGVPLNEEILYPAFESALKSKHLELLGLHFHVGSQLHDNFSHMAALDPAFKIIKRLKSDFNFSIKELNIGGGFGIHYTDADDKKSYEYFLNPVMAKIEEFFTREKMDRPAIVIEPGRSIVGEAGISLYRIGNIKSIPNTRTYVAVDGGMTDNIRYPLYDALYEGVIANKMDFPKDNMVTICGKCCESGDILIKDIPLPKPERNDVFAMFSTGAYGYSMASNYNKNNIPPVLLVKDGHSQVIVERQSYEDLVARDRPLL